ncbi:nucleotide-binding protein, partial [Candidatus Woesearchaeota archaeon]|nr:nucleotide-binding protein [Candidatus Woesearchaeota archaeon]
TNFLLIPGQFGVDVFTEIDRIMEEPYELFVLDMVLEELKRLAIGGTRDSAADKLGLKLLDSKGVGVLESLKTEKHLNTDKMIVETAKSPDYIVATQDMALKRMLKEKGVQLLVLRQKKHLKLI